jgi:hypothetical protein
MADGNDEQLRERLIAVRNKVLTPLLESFPPVGLPRGWSEDDVRVVLESGLVDFGTAGRHNGAEFTASQRALLYVRRNMGTHLDELVPLLTDVFSDVMGEVRANGLTLVDFGAGPFTAGLAAAAVFEDRLQPMRYFGIEIAPPMREVALKVIEAAKAEEMLFANDDLGLFESASDMPAGGLKTTHLTVVIASYLFANRQFSPARDLTPLLKWLAENRPLSEVYIISLNTENPAGQRNLPGVEGLLEADYEQWDRGREYLLQSRATQVLMWRRKQV